MTTGVNVFQRLGLSAVTSSGPKMRQYGGAGVWGHGGDSKRMSTPRQRLGGRGLDMRKAERAGEEMEV